MRFRLLRLLAAALFATSLSAAPAVRAGEPGEVPLGERCTTSQDGLTSILDCSPGFATRHDRIVIYPRGGDPGVDSQGTPNQEDAVWLVEPGASGRVALLIDFSRDEAGKPVAQLYDDGDGDQSVEYVITGEGPKSVEHEGRPTVTVTSHDVAWVIGDRTSFNLDIVVDGRLRASFWSSEFVDLLDTDGTVDFDVHVRDDDGDGRPDLEWRQFRPPLPEDPLFSRFVRTEITHSPSDREVPITGSLFWPYLAAIPREPADIYVKGRRESLPPIEVDWARARIHQVAEFVASRASASNYFVDSINRVVEGATTTPNFESPFAFYDLAGARDGWPDLSIRFKATLPFEVETPRRNANRINEITYSWGTRHDHTWSFGLSVVGHQDVEETIQFPEFSLRAMPPKALPRWVANEHWDAATFVEPPAGYVSTEGVTEFTVEQGDDVLARNYLSGVNPEPPVDAFSDVPAGFRGEYSFDLGGAPARLVLNPVDLRLHLVGAQAGVLNLGDGRELRYVSLDGRSIDHWALVEDDEVVSQLFAVADQVILANQAGVRISTSVGRDEPDPLVPPWDRASWEALRRLLEQSSPTFAADDLEAMFARIATTVDVLPAAGISELRPTGDGFRFDISLRQPGDTVPWARGLDPGTYVGSYVVGAGYALEARSPIALTVRNIRVVGDEARASEPVQLSAVVENRGNTDAQARVVFWAALDRTSVAPVRSTVVDVPAGESVAVAGTWVPPAGGDWFVQATVEGAGAVGPTVLVPVTPRPDVSPLSTLSAQQIPVPLLLAALILLLAAGVGAGLTAARLLRL